MVRKVGGGFLAGSISRYLEGLERRDPEAVRAIWDRYYAALVRYTRIRLAGVRRRDFDEEDVALSAFQSVCDSAAARAFTRLHDRQDLWHLLALVAARKAANERKRLGRLRRGGGQVRGDSALCAGRASTVPGFDGLAANVAPPDLQVEESEAFTRSLASLDDPMLCTIAVARLEGFTSREIAVRLRVAERTIERKLRIIRERLGFHSHGALAPRRSDADLDC
ncbi:MAG: ECF-type sigma factor [Pirellulales bacterium]